MREDILNKHADPKLKVFVVWLKKYPGAARSAWKPALLPDARVTHFWDEELISGRFFASHRKPKSGVEWDAFFVYGPKASWDETPAPLISFARPVKPNHQKLKDALLPLLKKPAK